MNDSNRRFRCESTAGHEVAEVDPRSLRDHFLLSKTDVAEMCDVSLPIVARWVSHGHLKPVKLPDLQRRMLFRYADVAAFIAACEVDGARAG